MVFAFTFMGLIIPLLFTQLLGAAVMTAASANGGNNVYMDQYNESGVGGLLAQVLVPKLGGFGKFCLVVLALSIIGNNIPNIYSVSLTMQVLSRWTQRVPRFVWTFIGTCVYVAIAIPGYSHFQRVLQNFMDLIGYAFSCSPVFAR
jgi:purine-cytosine permease-like protein